MHDDFAAVPDGEQITEETFMSFEDNKGEFDNDRGQ